MPKKHVLYEDDTKYLFTDINNYNAAVQNARTIYKFRKDEYTVEDIIDTFISYGSLTREDIVVKVKEN